MTEPALPPPEPPESPRAKGSGGSGDSGGSGGFQAMHALPVAFRKRISFWNHPARVMATGLIGLIAVGTALLMMPAATPGPARTSLRTALFTATSASSVTGLNIVDPGSYWSPFGQVVILVLIQVGGIGVMSSASLIAILVAGRMGLRSRLVAEYETRAMSLSTVRRVLGGTALLAVTTELVVGAIIALRLWLADDYPVGRALWFGLFHAVAAFNNAGFALWRDNLVSVSGDPWIMIPVASAIVIGGLGFLVVFELARVRPAVMWTVHTKVTLTVTAVLLVLGPAAIMISEWNNPGTLGSLDVHGRIISGVFSGVTPRTAGFNSIDYGQAGTASLLFTDILMFIGGGSGSTAGGIKVTTFAILIMAVVAEARGDRDVDIYGRRMAPATVRQAVAVATLGMAMVLTSSLVMLEMTGLPLDDVLFEVTSALCTVGLSTGITAGLPAQGHYLLVLLMYVGRIGSITVVTALALRTGGRSYRNPEGRPIVG